MFFYGIIITEKPYIAQLLDNNVKKNHIAIFLKILMGKQFRSFVADRRNNALFRQIFITL